MCVCTVVVLQWIIVLYWHSENFVSGEITKNKQIMKQNIKGKRHIRIFTVYIIVKEETT